MPAIDDKAAAWLRSRKGRLSGHLRAVLSLAVVLAAAGSLLFVSPPTTEAITADNYRWRADDGDETSATWVGTENNSIDFDRNSTKRLRFGLTEPNDGVTPALVRNLAFPDQVPGPEYGFSTEALDSASGFAYLGTNTAPCKIVKVQLATMSIVGELELNSGEDYCTASVMDSWGNAYFLTNGAAKKFVKVELAGLTRVDALTLTGTGTNEALTAVAHVFPDIAYVSVGVSINKIDIRPFESFAYLGKFDLPGSVGYVTAGVLDTLNQFAIYSTSDADRIYKVPAANSTGPPFAGGIGVTDATHSFAGNFLTAEFVPGDNYAYFGASNGRVYRIDVRQGAPPGTAPIVLGYVQLSRPATGNLGPLVGSFIDPAGGYVYFRDTSWIQRVRLADFAKMENIGYSSSYFGVDGFNNRLLFYDSVTAKAYLGAGSKQSVLVRFPLSVMTSGDVIFDFEESDLLYTEGVTNIDDFCSIVADYGTGHLYLGTGYPSVTPRAAPAHLLKVRMSDMTVVGDLMMLPGEQDLCSAVIDTGNGFAYFAADGIVGDPNDSTNYTDRVVKVGLGVGDAPPSRIGHLELPDRYLTHYTFADSGIDAGDGYAYLGAPGRFVKVGLGAGSAPPYYVGEVAVQGNFTNSVLIDADDDFGYVATSNGGNRFYKMALGTGDTAPSVIGYVDLGTAYPGGASPYSGVLDSTNGYAYLSATGAGTNKGVILKIKLGAGVAPPALVNFLELGAEDDWRIFNGIIDVPAGLMYFARQEQVGVFPAITYRYHIITLDVGTGDAPPALLASVYLGASAPALSFYGSETIDLERSYGFFKTYGSAITQIDLAAHLPSKFRLQVAPKTGPSCDTASGWEWVDSASSLFRTATSSGLTSGAATTDSAGLTNAGSQFVAGSQVEAPGSQTQTVLLTQNDYTENEYALTIGPGAVDFQAYCFRQYHYLGSYYDRTSQARYAEATVIPPVPDLSTSSLTDNDADNVLFRGQEVTYTLNIINTGSGAGSGIDISELLDSDTENLAVQSLVGCGTYTDNSVADPPELDIAGIDVALAGTCVVTYKANVRNDAPYGGTVRGSVSIAAASEGGAGASPQSDLMDLPEPPNLSTSSVAENDGDNRVTPGQTVTYTVTLSNSGSMDATGIDLTASPSALENITGFSMGPGCGSPTNGSTGTAVNITDLDIDVGTDCVISFTADAVSGLSENDPVALALDVSASDQGGSPQTLNATTLGMDVTPDLSTSTLADNDGDDVLVRGQNIDYTLTLNNTGDGLGTGISATDTLDTDQENLSLVSAVGCGSYTDNSVANPPALNITGISVPAAGSCVIVFRAKVLDAGAWGSTVQETVTVSPAAEGGVGASPSSDLMTLKEPPNLSTSTAVDDDADNLVAPAQVVNYTVTLTNSGDQDGTAIGLTGTPTRLTSLSNFNFSGCGSPTDNSTGTAVNVSGISISAGSDCTVTFASEVIGGLAESDPVDLQLTASAAAEGGSPVVINAPTLLADVTPNLSTSSLSDDDTDNILVRGQTTEYVLTIINTGDGLGTGISVNDTLDTDQENLSVVSLTGCGSYTDNSTANPPVLEVDNVSVAASGSCEIVFRAEVKNSATFGSSVQESVNVTAAVEGGVGANPSADLLVLLEPPDLSNSTLTEDDADDVVSPGQVITYSVRLSNSGTRDGTGISLSGSSAGLNGIGGFTIGAGCGSPTDSSNATSVAISGISVSSGTDCLIDFTARVAATLYENDPVDLQLTVSAPAEGGSPVNLNASTLLVDVTPDLSGSNLTDDDADDLVEPGQTVTWTATVSNSGDGIATGIRLASVLDSDLIDPYGFTDNGACGVINNISSGHNIDIEDISVSPGTDCLITYKADVLTPLNEGTTVNTTMTAFAPNEGGGNETLAALQLTVDATPDLSASAIADDDDGDGELSQSQLLAYILTVSNTGNGLGSDIEVNSVLDDTLEDLEVQTMVNCGSPINRSNSTRLEVTNIRVAVGTPCVITYNASVLKDAVDGEPVDALVNVTAAAEGGSGEAVIHPGLVVRVPPLPDFSTSVLTDNDGNDIVVNGQTIAFSYAIANTGLADATGVDVDVSPGPEWTNLQNVSVTGSCGAAYSDDSTGSAVAISGLELAVGDSCMVLFSADVESSVIHGTQFTMTAVSSPAIEGGLGMAAVSDEFTLESFPNLTDSNLVDDAGGNVVPGQTVNYTLSVINDGAGIGTGISLELPLDPSLENLRTVSFGSGCGSAPSDDSDVANVRASNLEVDVGLPFCEITFTADVVSPLAYGTVISQQGFINPASEGGVGVPVAAPDRTVGAADVTPGDLCPGNVCRGQLTVGGQPVEYYYNQYLRSDGHLRIRFNGGYYDPAHPKADALISFMVFNLPQFDTVTSYVNPHDSTTPAGSHLLPPLTDVNLGRTAYERYSETGCASGCHIDFAMDLDYSGLPVGDYTFDMYVFQLGAPGSKTGLEFKVAAGAPTNTDESESLDPLVNPMADASVPDYIECADRFLDGEQIDNDLDFYPNCRDDQCEGQPGSSIDPTKTCEINEVTCWDYTSVWPSTPYDNDGDGLPNCLDDDCHLKCGRKNLAGKCTGYCMINDEYGLPDSLPGNADPCDDNFDNDGDGRADCQDNLEYLGPGEYREYTWLNDDPAADPPIYGALDNPAAPICWRHADYRCPVSETNCTSGGDDDVDYMYSPDVYDYGHSGSNCQDYDCAGAPNCPYQENLLPDGSDAAGNCFDFFIDYTGELAGKDNDLDYLANCADPDCQGIENPASAIRQICSDREFDLGQRVNMCNDFIEGTDLPFDNDGDGPANCLDNDCKGRFGYCQWCPSIEDYRFDSCAYDGFGEPHDNNGDDLINCSDPDCLNRIGLVEGAAYCRASEAAGDPAAQCSDGLDNDGDGLTDCEDDECAGVPNADGFRCEQGSETGANCGDAGDNDYDDPEVHTPDIQNPTENQGLGLDCLDRQCWTGGLSHCLDFDWEVAECQDVPASTGPVPIVGADNDPTVYADVDYASRVGMVHTMVITGTGTYPDLSLFIGSAVDDEFNYPYAHTTCTLADPNNPPASHYKMVVVLGEALMISTTAPITDPEITVTCQLPTGPTDERTFNVSLSATRASGLPEYGEVIFTNRVYENNPPQITGIEIEGETPGADKLVVPYGAQRQIRVPARDPDQPDPSLSSGICQCTVRFGGREYQSPDGECVIDPIRNGRTVRFGSSGSLSYQAIAEDGADNVSAWGPGRTIEVQVLPVVTYDLVFLLSAADLSRDQDYKSPFFSRTRVPHRKMALDAGFHSANGSGSRFSPFSSTCDVNFYDQDGGLQATLPMSRRPSASNQKLCHGEVDLSDLPAAFRDQNENVNDHYYVTVSVEDGNGNRAETERQEFFICDGLPNQRDGAGYNPCHWADFDNDRMTEGYYTWVYTTGNPIETDPLITDPSNLDTAMAARPCDNCVGVSNPEQTDLNMDGIGDFCKQDGRCYIDRDYACRSFSHGYRPDQDSDPGTCSKVGEDSEYMCCGSSGDATCCSKPTLTRDVATGNQMGECVDPLLGIPVDKDGKEGTDTCCLGCTNPPSRMCVDSDICQPQQACDPDWGVCSITGFICFSNDDCPRIGECRHGDGSLVDDDGNGLADFTCRSDADCDMVNGQWCDGGEQCIGLVYPWIEALFGNVYTRKQIRSQEPPPEDMYNATYCITAKARIDVVDIGGTSQEVFQSQLCSKTELDKERDESSNLARPQEANFYGTSLGRLDIVGLLEGRYGEIIELTPSTFRDYFSPIASGAALKGKVYLVDGDLVIDDSFVVPDSIDSEESGAGTVVVIGDIYFRKNTYYPDDHVVGMRSTRQIGSIGWIALEGPNRTGGDMFIEGDVEELVGAFFLGGQGGLYTVAPPATDSSIPLTIHGLVLARSFRLSRFYRSEDRGSEQFVYDGRALLNPPPGFADLAKSLPIYGSQPPLP